jgi:predicted CXXCH cytochrome family protein
MIREGQGQKDEFTGHRDSHPPRITDVEVEEIRSGVLVSVTITWKTDEPSDSQVEYGIGSATERITPLDAGMVRAHRVTILGLSPGEMYDFRVRSTDAAGNTGVSGDHTFSTVLKRSGGKWELYSQRLFSGLSTATSPSWAAEDPSFFISTVKVIQLSDHSATIEWQTDRAADSRIEYDTERDSLHSEAFTHLPLKDRREMTIDGCYECHPDLLKGPSHPVGIFPKPQMKVSQDLPRIEGGMITCVTCHEPHRSLERYLLRKNWKRELCVNCHDPDNLQGE